MSIIINVSPKDNNQLPKAGPGTYHGRIASAKVRRNDRLGCNEILVRWDLENENGQFVGFDTFPLTDRLLWKVEALCRCIGLIGQFYVEQLAFTLPDHECTVVIYEKNGFPTYKYIPRKINSTKPAEGFGNDIFA